MSQLDRVLERAEVRAAGRIPGEDAFRLYDTFGLPPDLVEEVAGEQGLGVDRAGFEERMERQRQRARRSWKGRPAAAGIAYGELAGGRPTEFTGYRNLDDGGIRVLTALAKDGGGLSPAPSLSRGQEGELLLDRTPLYPEGGGQGGDRGVIRGEGGLAEVLNTRSADGMVVHEVRIREGDIGAGQRVEAVVDRGRRTGAARHHTMTHLLHAALRDTLGPHVKQAGSLVAPDRLRFDFTHFAPLTAGELETIEGQVNRQVRADREVLASVMPLDDALGRGALAFFGDKYGTEVRVIEVPEFSIELCGGTHLQATGEAGLFVIVSEESIAAGVRRIGALTGAAAVGHVLQGRRLLDRIGRAARSRPEEVPRKLERMRTDLKRMEKEVERLRDRLVVGASTSAGNGADLEDIAGVRVWMPEPLQGASKHEHRRLMDAFRDRQQGPRWLALSSNVRGGRAAVILGMSSEVAARLPANRLLLEAAARIGGRGGGRADRAEGGGPRVEGLPALREHIREALRAAFAA